MAQHTIYKEVTAAELQAIETAETACLGALYLVTDSSNELWLGITGGLLAGPFNAGVANVEPKSITVTLAGGVSVFIAYLGEDGPTAEISGTIYRITEPAGTKVTEVDIETVDTDGVALTGNELTVQFVANPPKGRRRFNVDLYSKQNNTRVSGSRFAPRQPPPAAGTTTISIPNIAGSFSAGFILQMR